MNMINVCLINLLLIGSETESTVVVYTCKVLVDVRAWMETENWKGYYLPAHRQARIQRTKQMCAFVSSLFSLFIFILMYYYVVFEPITIPWPLFGLSTNAVCFLWACLHVCIYKSTFLKFSTCARRITKSIYIIHIHKHLHWVFTTRART